MLRLNTAAAGAVDCGRGIGLGEYLTQALLLGHVDEHGDAVRTVRTATAMKEST
jgi:hypothetical protein